MTIPLSTLRTTADSVRVAPSGGSKARLGRIIELLYGEGCINEGERLILMSRLSSGDMVTLILLAGIECLIGGKQ